MAEHLKYGASGHLMFGPNGHLVHTCGGIPCPDDNMEALSDVYTVSGTFVGGDCDGLPFSIQIERDPGDLGFWSAEIAGTDGGECPFNVELTHTPAQDEENPCRYELVIVTNGISGAENFSAEKEGGEPDSGTYTPVVTTNYTVSGLSVS